MIKMTIFIQFIFTNVIFYNPLYDSYGFKIPKWISEKEIVKWSVMEGSDASIYLNIKVK